MAKQIIRLTESDLHRIIKESVRRIIKEENWDDELSSIYDAGKEEGSTGVDIDRASSVMKNLKAQYGKDKEGYGKAINNFFNRREKLDDYEKAKKDPAFELWSDEHETSFNDAGYPMAKDFKPLPFEKKKYNNRVRNGELPKALRRSYTKGGEYDSDSFDAGENNPYSGKSPEEIEQMMRDSGYVK